MLNKIAEFCAAFFGVLLDAFGWLLDGLLYVVSEIFYVILDVLLTILETIVNALDFAELTALNAFDQWDLLPPQILYVLSELHFTQILAILAAAYTIRLFLNIIPATFTRV